MILKLCFTLFFLSFAKLTQLDKAPVTVFLIGDSTMQGGNGEELTDTRGWGDFLQDHFAPVQARVINKAKGGRSSRTFITEGLWKKVHEQLDSGDYVIIQFGHNDGGPINDDFRARGSIKGNGEESEVIDNILTERREIVKSYGWYIRKYIADTKAKGAIPIVCSPVARNRWTDGKVNRSTYAPWAKAAAKMEGARFIALNKLTALKLESLGEKHVTQNLFCPDRTHTNINGAKLNAQLVAEAILSLSNCDLKDQLIRN